VGLGLTGGLASPAGPSVGAAGPSADGSSQIPLGVDLSDANGVSDAVTTVRPVTSAQRPYTGDMGARVPPLVRPHNLVIASDMSDCADV
jgi:hypothetical protein